MSHIPNNNPTTLTSLQEEVLNGLMLGDGCLGIRKQCINPRLTIRRQSRDIEYLNYTFNIFRDMCRDKAVTTRSRSLFSAYVLTKEINANGIRSNVLNYMKEQNTFSTKDICRDLGYFYSSRFGKFFANSTVIKYMKKCFDDGVVIATNNDLKVLLNTKLKYVA